MRGLGFKGLRYIGLRAKILDYQILTRRFGALENEAQVRSA